MRYLGFTCKRESKVDQFPSGSDEPYFLIAVMSGQGSKTVKFGPFENIDSGSVNFEAGTIVDIADGCSLPISIGVVVIEHDSGSPEEAEQKVRKAVEDAEKKFDQIVSAFMGAPTGNHVLPEWARDIIVGWVPEGAASVLDLADDLVGKNVSLLFDNRPDVSEWQPLPVRGKHGDNEYNWVINVNGGDEGEYDVFFKVDLAEISVVWK